MKLNLLEKYHQQTVPTLVKEFNLSNKLAAPRVAKVVINIGITDEQHRDQSIDNMAEQLKVITGQKPKLNRAKKSIAGFKLREGDSVGLMVTLRGKRMYQFLDKLFNIVLPRVKDFQGITRHFDGRGNYNLGIEEQIVFPEIDYGKIDQVRSLQVTIVTTATNDPIAERLLELLGAPFVKKD